ncbi:MAG: HD-GYP domain-containing protein [Desulfobulbia bacterium]
MPKNHCPGKISRHPHFYPARQKPGVVKHQAIGLGGLLHDVGKMAVPLAILNKPSALNDAEFKKIQQHVVCCREILADALVQLQSGMLGVVVESTDSLLRPVVRLVYDTKRDWAVSPKDIDLSKPNGKGGESTRSRFSASPDFPREYRLSPTPVYRLFPIYFPGQLR